VRLFFAISLIFVFSSLALGFGSKRSKYPEHFENRKWDASKPPVIEEPPLKNQKAIAAWGKAVNEPSPYCDSNQSWIASNGSRLEAVGVKEHNIEVRGAFLRFRTCLLPEPDRGIAAGQGWVEMSSWDSGLEARDRRVTRYVFGIEEDGQSITPFDFKIEPFNSAAKEGESWNASLTTKALFRGLVIQNDFPVKITWQKGTYRIITEQPQQLNFMNAAVESGFRQMMDLCNHHFLAAFAFVNFDLNMLPRHKIHSGKTKKK
jgi:hypothetical protein